MKINFGQKQTDRYLFLVCGIESLQGVWMHLLKRSRVSNTRSRLPTSLIPCRLRTRIEINSWNNRTATGSHFNPLPVLFARINSPPRPQTNPRAEQIWKSWACTQEHGRKGDRRWGHAALYYYCTKESSGIGRLMQQSQIQAGWWLYREHFRADDTERRTHFTPPRQDGTEPLCWHAHIYWT